MAHVISRAQLNALPRECRKAPVILPFTTWAYAFGQYVLPYHVTVTHKKTRSLGAAAAH